MFYNDLDYTKLLRQALNHYAKIDNLNTLSYILDRPYPYGIDYNVLHDMNVLMDHFNNDIAKLIHKEYYMNYTIPEYDNIEYLDTH